MTNNPVDAKVAALQQEIADKKVDAMGEELRRLKLELDQVQLEFDQARAVQLLQANERLLLAALKAESVAETTMVKLSELTYCAQGVGLADTRNGALMLNQLQTAIGMAKCKDTHIAVFFVDVDCFRDINDAHGVVAGDEVLERVAHRLEAVVRGADSLTHHSGDEFLVLLAEISQSTDAALIAAKMLTAIAASPQLGAPQCPVSASIGIAIYPEDGEDASGLIGRAGEAMARAKQGGSCGFQFHNADFLSHNIIRLPEKSKPAPRVQDEPEQEPHPQHMSRLSEAKEQLRLSTLASHGSQEQRTHAHLRQVKFLEIVTDLLNRADHDEQQNARLQTMIKQQVAHMAKIVEDILHGSRIVTDPSGLNHTNLDLGGILNLTIGSCQPAMDAKLQCLRAQLPSGPLAVHGNSEQLTKIFQNLLANASKHTHEGGGIAITALMLRGTIVTSVCDNGTGISAEALPHVFDFLTKDPSVTAGKGGGYSMDLATVRTLIEAHGGSVVATSAGRDLGSEFVVTLPLVAQ